MPFLSQISYKFLKNELFFMLVYDSWGTLQFARLMYRMTIANFEIIKTM